MINEFREVKMTIKKEEEKKNNKMGSRHITHQSRQLLGKVVFLVGNDSKVLQSLVKQLAQKGADIALLCWQLPWETARKIKESVQAFGREILLIVPTERETPSTTQLIQAITGELGHLDIFIDLSARSPELPIQAEAADVDKQQATRSQPNWQLTRAVLEEMVYP